MKKKKKENVIQARTKYGVGLIEGIKCVINGTDWAENATWRRSQGGLTSSSDRHWIAHKFQDDDGQTQTSVSWA